MDSQGRGLGGEIVVGEKQVRGFAEGRAGILGVCGRAHSEIDASPAACHRSRIDLVGETQSRSNVFPVGRNGSHARCRELGCAEHLHRRWIIQSGRLHGCLGAERTRRRRHRDRIQWDIHAAIGGEIAELDLITARRVRRTPLVTHAQIDRKFRGHLSSRPGYKTLSRASGSRPKE